MDEEVDDDGYIQLLYSKTPRPSVLKILLYPHLPILVVDNIISHIYSSVFLEGPPIISGNNSSDKQEAMCQMKDTLDLFSRPVQILCIECPKYLTKLSIAPCHIPQNLRFVVAKTKFKFLKVLHLNTSISNTSIEHLNTDNDSTIKFLQDFLPNHTLDFMQLFYHDFIKVYADVLSNSKTQIEIFEFDSFIEEILDTNDELDDDDEEISDDDDQEILDKNNDFLKLVSNVKEMTVMHIRGKYDVDFETDMSLFDDFCRLIEKSLKVNSCIIYQFEFVSYTIAHIKVFADRFKKYFEYLSDYVVEYSDNQDYFAVLKRAYN